MQDSLTNQKPTNVRWKIFIILFLLVVVSMIDRASISIAMPTIAKDLNLSGTMQGLILSGFFWTYAIMQIPGGLLADKYGARIVLTISALIWGLAEAMLGLCPTGFALLIANLFIGAAEAPLFPSGARLNAIWLSQAERARGATLMDAGGPIGAALGGILVAQMILFFNSWRITFVICGAMAIVLGVFAFLFVRDKISAAKNINEAEIKLISANNQNTSTTSADRIDNRSLFEAVSKRSLVGILIGRCVWAMCFFGLLTWGPSYLTQALSLDLKEVGFATLIIFISGGLGSICGGYLADKLSLTSLKRGRACKLLLTISGLCTLIAFALLPNVPNISTSILLLSCAAFVLMWGSMYWSFPPLLAPKSKVATLGGMMNMAGSIGGICIPLLVGYIWDKTGSFDLVLYFFALCAVVFIIMTNLIDLKKVS